MGVVELRREEGRRALEDLGGLAQLEHLTFQLGDPLPVIRRGAQSGATAALGLVARVCAAFRGCCSAAPRLGPVHPSVDAFLAERSTAVYPRACGGS